MDIAPIVKHYVALRDQKAEIEARHKEELEPIRKDMDMIEGALMKVLQDGGQKSAKTDFGTAYISEVESIKITNKDEVIDEVIEKGLWDVLNISIAKKNYREAGVELPGIDISTTRKLNVRRS